MASISIAVLFCSVLEFGYLAISRSKYTRAILHTTTDRGAKPLTLDRQPHDRG